MTAVIRVPTRFSICFPNSSGGWPDALGPGRTEDAMTANRPSNANARRARTDPSGKPRALFGSDKPIKCMRVVKTSSAAKRSNTLESASTGRPKPVFNFVTTTQVKIPIPVRSLRTQASQQMSSSISRPRISVISLAVAGCDRCQGLS